jgi:hypothetical protein
MVGRSPGLSFSSNERPSPVEQPPRAPIALNDSRQAGDAPRQRTEGLPHPWNDIEFEPPHTERLSLLLDLHWAPQRSSGREAVTYKNRHPTSRLMNSAEGVGLDRPRACDATSHCTAQAAQPTSTPDPWKGPLGLTTHSFDAKHRSCELTLPIAIHEPPSPMHSSTEDARAAPTGSDVSRAYNQP